MTTTTTKFDASTLLIPCPRAMLAPGLSVISRISLGAYLLGDPWDAAYWRALPRTEPGSVHTIPLAPMDMLVDLRDPPVRDRLARCLWTALRPGEPALLTAPCWYYDDGAECWWAEVTTGYGRDTHETFATKAGSCCSGSPTHPDHNTHAVPALAAVDLASPDRDLLALAAVVAHVLGSAA